MKCSWKISLILLASIFAQEAETEEIEEKKEKSEFITTNCQKTNVEIFIPKWTVSNGPPASVTLLSALGNNCRGAYHNKTHITLNINLLDPKRDCGTTRRSQGVQIIYENKLSFTDQKSRKIEDLANITCIQYLQEKHVRLPSSAAINNLQAGPVSIKTQMKLFNTAKFEEELEDLAKKGYAQVAVREFIYVRVAFDFAENEAAMETDKVVIDSCWGSRSANPDNMKTAYMMIENGCSADPLGVIIRQNSAGAYASWKFQMYKWTTVAQHEQFIYIHCRAWICTDCQKPEANHACLGDITKFRRRRAAKLFQNREVSSERARIFSVGPIYPRDGSVPLLSDVESDDPAVKGEIPGMPGMGDEEEEDNFIMAVIVGSVSGFCALFLLIVAIVFVKKYREKPFQIFTKPAEEEEDEKNIEQGFVFELRTSTDPVIPRVNLDQFLGRDDEPREQRERKTERRSHHGSRMSLNKEDRGGRRRRDRSESRDRKGRSRSESRTREGGRSGSKDRGRDRDRSRSRERSSRHGSREKLHSSSRDLRKSRDNIRGSKSDLRDRRSGSRDDLSSGRMRKSGSRMSLNDRLPTLDERRLSEAEKELMHAISSLKKTGSRASISRSLDKNDDFQTFEDEYQFTSPRELRKSRSKMSINENGEKISRSASKRSRGRRSESRNRDRDGRERGEDEKKERSRDRSSSRTRGHRSESRSRRSPKSSRRSESRDRRHHSPTSRKRSESRHRSPSRDRRKRSPSRDRRRSESRTNRENVGRSEEKSRKRSPSRQRRSKKDPEADHHHGSTADLRDQGGDQGKRRRRRKNKERPENPDEAFSAL